MLNPYVFIVGCPRSGTTLLRRIVSAHPQIVITPEAHWIPLWFAERRGLTPDGLVTPELIPALLAHDKFAMFGLGPDELTSLAGRGQQISFASFVTGIFDLYGKARGKELVGNKTPDSARRMDTLHALWPRARFLHLIRDGRDVALSLMNWPKVRNKTPGKLPTWKEEHVRGGRVDIGDRFGGDDDPLRPQFGGCEAADLVSEGPRVGEEQWRVETEDDEAGKLLGSQLYREFRYESLLAHPDQVCAELCEFLGLPYDEAMLHYHEASEKDRPGVEAGHDREPITPGLRNWKTQMSAEDVEHFEAAAGALLDELNYPRAFARLGTAAVEQSARIRTLLAGPLPSIRAYRAA